MSDVTEARRLMEIVAANRGDTDFAVGYIAAALADERAKARAQVAADLRDLLSDSGGNVWIPALRDFARGLETT